MDIDSDILWSCENILLLGDKLECLPLDIRWNSEFQDGYYSDIVESGVCAKFFSDFVQSDRDESDINLDRLVQCINDFIERNDSATCQYEVLIVGIAALQGFVQANWTGPKYLPKDPELPCIIPALLKFLPEEMLQTKDIAECLRLFLSIDGEEVCTSVIYPELLILAQVCFKSNLTLIKSSEWWLSRSLHIHQQIMDEHSPTLIATIMSISNKLFTCGWVIENISLKVLLHLEAASVQLQYGKVVISDLEIKEALSLLNMEVHLTGALGRRTHYQRRDLAQLSLNVKIEKPVCSDNYTDSSHIQFPKDILLNDDVRLPHIVFANASDGDLPDLQPLEQAALISVFVQKKKSQAKDNLQNEELLPLLSCILAHPKVWALQFSALHFRSRIECEHKRTLERALLQTEELMDTELNTTPLPLRLRLFYCSYAPSSFILSAECASILYSMGSVQAALDIYLKLQIWDDVIACYNYLKLRHKAAEVIRKQMQKGETVSLWCSLGDATDDVTCYERAWELSNHKSAQAQRHWGIYFFQRKQYKEAMTHFKKSLEINSLQISLWFRYGFAALIEQELEECATAYRRYCALEPESFEAWNNLAKAYILLGQKERAYNALQEAVKCNYEKWQVWDNLMAVSCDCGDFEEVIRCYHRIMDLKDKHIDEHILSVLTAAIIQGIKDCRGRPSSVHRKKTLELFGRITSKVMGNPIVWKLYGDLTNSIEEQSSITRSKTIQYYQKAYTAAMQDSMWFKEIHSMHKLIHICESLVEAHFNFVKESSSANESIHSLNSAKLSIQNFLAKLSVHLVEANLEQHEQFNKDHLCLQEKLERIKGELNKLRSINN